jgi:hypothetical protein
MTRSQAKKLLVDLENNAITFDLGAEEVAGQILLVLDTALRFEPEVMEISGTARSVSRVS